MIICCYANKRLCWYLVYIDLTSNHDAAMPLSLGKGDPKCPKLPLSRLCARPPACSAASWPPSTAADGQRTDCNPQRRPALFRALKLEILLSDSATFVSLPDRNSSFRLTWLRFFGAIFFCRAVVQIVADEESLRHLQAATGNDIALSGWHNKYKNGHASARHERKRASGGNYDGHGSGERAALPDASAILIAGRNLRSASPRW